MNQLLLKTWNLFNLDLWNFNEKLPVICTKSYFQMEKPTIIGFRMHGFSRLFAQIFK